MPGHGWSESGSGPGSESGSGPGPGSGSVVRLRSWWFLRLSAPVWSESIDEICSVNMASVKRPKSTW
eukprot:scaffold69605_cov63-Phaeocystis_antarctica.AAC.4